MSTSLWLDRNPLQHEMQAVQECSHDVHGEQDLRYPLCFHPSAVPRQEQRARIQLGRTSDSDSGGVTLESVDLLFVIPVAVGVAMFASLTESVDARGRTATQGEGAKPAVSSEESDDCLGVLTLTSSESPYLVRVDIPDPQEKAS